MKRRNFLSILTQLAIATSLFGGQQALAQTATEKIAALRISGLEQYQGQYATVIYGINNNILVNNSANAFLTKIRLQTEPQMITNGEIKVPAVSLSRSGIFEAYNAIVIVVHMQTKLDWMNADNSVPEGASKGPNNDFKAVINITKKEYQKQQLGQGMPDLVEIKTK